MQKSYFLLVFTLIFSFLFVGCSGSDDDKKTTESEISTTEITSTEYIDENGGNPVEINITYYRITISENKYFYDNHEISFKDLKKDIDDFDDTIIVEISDENATQNAYKQLVDVLEDKKISYIEKTE